MTYQSLAFSGGTFLFSEWHGSLFPCGAALVSHAHAFWGLATADPPSAGWGLGVAPPPTRDGFAPSPQLLPLPSRVHPPGEVGGWDLGGTECTGPQEAQAHVLTRPSLPDSASAPAPDSDVMIRMAGG